MIHSIIILQMLFACSTPINKFLLGLASPLVLMSMRLLLAGIVLLSGSIMTIKQPRTLLFKKQHISIFIQKVFFGSYIKYFLKYWGLQYMPSVKMAFLLYTTPFVAALLNYMMHKEIVSRRQWAGMSIGFLGVLPIVFVRSPAEEFLSLFTIFSWPEMAILLAVIAHSYGTLCTQKLIRTYHYPAPLIGGMSSLCAGMLALITACLTSTPLTISDPGLFIPWFLVLIIMSNVISHTWYIRLLGQHSTTFLALADYLNPLFIALYSILFLGEKLSWHYALSSIIIFAGLYLFNSKSSSQ